MRLEDFESKEMIKRIKQKRESAEHQTLETIANGVRGGAYQKEPTITVDIDITLAEEKMKRLCARCEKLNETINGFLRSTDELTKRMTELTKRLKEIDE